MKKPFRDLRKNKAKGKQERDPAYVEANIDIPDVKQNLITRQKFSELIYQPEHCAMQRPSEFWRVIERIANINPRSILELGVCMGGSLYVFDHMLDKNGLLVGVDYEPTNVNWNYEDSENEIHLVRGDTRDPKVYDKVKSVLNGRKVDVLFHDADHSHPTVKNDIELYGSLVRDGGLIVISDLVYVYDWCKNLGVIKPEDAHGNSKKLWHKEEIMEFTGTGFLTKIPEQTIIQFKE